MVLPRASTAIPPIVADNKDVCDIFDPIAECVNQDAYTAAVTPLESALKYTKNNVSLRLGAQDADHIRRGIRRPFSNERTEGIIYGDDSPTHSLQKKRKPVGLCEIA